MSEYHQCILGIKDRNILMQTLEEMLNDNRKQKAHIVIPKEQISSSSNDIGFEWINQKKEYKIWISDYDEKAKIVNNKISKEKLKKLYKKNHLLTKLKKSKNYKRIKSTKVEENEGKIKIKLGIE